MPAAAPAQSCRRARKPQAVPIRQVKRREENLERVGDERGVEMIQVARAQDDQSGQNQKDNSATGENQGPMTFKAFAQAISAAGRARGDRFVVEVAPNFHGKAVGGFVAA